MKFNNPKPKFPEIGIGVLAIINDKTERYITIAEYRGTEWWDRVSFDGYRNEHIIPLQNVEAWVDLNYIYHEFKKEHDND